MNKAFHKSTLTPSKQPSRKDVLAYTLSNYEIGKLCSAPIHALTLSGKDLDGLLARPTIVVLKGPHGVLALLGA